MADYVYACRKTAILTFYNILKQNNTFDRDLVWSTFDVLAEGTLEAALDSGCDAARLADSFFSPAVAEAEDLRDFRSAGAGDGESSPVLAELFRSAGAGVTAKEGEGGSFSSGEGLSSVVVAAALLRWAAISVPTSASGLSVLIGPWSSLIVEGPVSSAIAVLLFHEF